MAKPQPSIPQKNNDEKLEVCGKRDKDDHWPWIATAYHNEIIVGFGTLSKF